MDPFAIAALGAALGLTHQETEAVWSELVQLPAGIARTPSSALLEFVAAADALGIKGDIIVALRQTGQDAASAERIEKLFAIAQDSPATKEELEAQASIRAAFKSLAHRIDAAVADGREKSLALTKLEEALMWTGRAIFVKDTTGAVEAVRSRP